jgi:O-glycosyl hydrolase
MWHRQFVVWVALIVSAREGAAQSVVIDATQTYQAVDGFGAAQTWDFPEHGSHDPNSNAYLYAWATSGDATKMARASEVLDVAFSRTKGIGLTILRSMLRPQLQPSPGVWNDCIAGRPCFDNEGRWMMREVGYRGPVKLMASVWSPPGWMKTNGLAKGGYCSNSSGTDFRYPLTPCVTDECGDGYACISGSLDPTRYLDYAKYLAYYASTFAPANNLDIYAISIQNEPETAGVDWYTCKWNGSQISSFLANELRAEFAYQGVTTKIIAPEASGWDLVESSNLPLAPNYGQFFPSEDTRPFMAATYGNPNALAEVDIVASHLYGGDYSLPFTTAIDSGKPIWQTEAGGNWNDCPSGVSGPTGIGDEVCAWDENEGYFDPRATTCSTMSCALLWSRTIWTSLTGGRVSAWLWWLLAYNYPSSGNLIHLNNSNVSFGTSKAFWVLGNYSKFIRPGYVRMNVTESIPEFWVAAFKDPTTGQVVIVATNGGTVPVSVNFSSFGFSLGMATPWVTSATNDLWVVPRVNLATTQTIGAATVVTYVLQSTSDILWRKTDGTLSTWFMKSSGSLLDAASTKPAPANTQFKGARDFNGDGLSDIVWRDPSTGVVTIWLVNGTNVYGQFNPGGAGAPWTLVGTGDVDGDRIGDLIWYNTSAGTVACWIMNSNGSVREYRDPGSLLGWNIRAIADFNADGRTDLLWQNSTQPSSLRIWFLNNGYLVGNSAVNTAIPIGFTYQGVGDINKDSKADIILRSSSTTRIWRMNGSFVQTPYNDLAGPASNWTFQGAADISADGTADLVWRNTSGLVSVWVMSTNFAVNWYHDPGSLPSDMSIQGFGVFD